MEYDVLLICNECADAFPSLTLWRYDHDWKVCDNCHEMLENMEEE